MADQKRLNEEQKGSQKLAEAEYHIKEVFKILQDETTRLRQEQEAVDAISKKLAHVHFSSTVKLNVGGHTFTTSVQTLTKDPNSMLAAMFSGKFEMKPAEDGAFFIDRDGTQFRFILNYLRTGKLTLPEGATFLKELEEEAEFYQIQGIIDEMKSTKVEIQAVRPLNNPFEVSDILTNDDHRRILRGWLSEFRGEWRLLHRATRDGFEAANFHANCDDKGPTVTIVKSGNNIFGGFTEMSWQSGPDRGYTSCTKAFLFSLDNPLGLEPTKMPLKDSYQQLSAMKCHSDYGPTFGNGHDLYISGRSGSIYLDCSYECPHDLGDQQRRFFTGSGRFQITNYEVFGIL